MGFFGFVKSAAKKLGAGVAHAAKWIGQNAKPAIHAVASAVEKAAPYVSGLAGAFGQTGIADVANKIGRYAGVAKAFTMPRPAQPQPSGAGPGGG